MKIRILSPAERDLEEGYRFYESQSPVLDLISSIPFILISTP